MKYEQQDQARWSNFTQKNDLKHCTSKKAHDQGTRNAGLICAFIVIAYIFALSIVGMI
jgi:hypothetical protein